MLILDRIFCHGRHKGHGDVRQVIPSCPWFIALRNPFMTNLYKKMGLGHLLVAMSSVPQIVKGRGIDYSRESHRVHFWDGVSKTDPTRWCRLLAPSVAHGPLCEHPWETGGDANSHPHLPQSCRVSTCIITRFQVLFGHVKVWEMLASTNLHINFLALAWHQAGEIILNSVFEENLFLWTTTQIDQR